MPTGISEKADRTLALVLLTKEILNQNDEIAALMSKGRPAQISKLLLREMCGVLKELSPEVQAEYFEILGAISGKHAPQHVVPSEDYIDLGVKHKKRLISDLRERLVGAA